MAEAGNGERLMQFLGCGIYRLESSKAVFIDPVRVLNRSYSRFKISPSAYYSRFFESYETRTGVSSSPRKRKRKEKRPPLALALALNERELAADRRHQEVRPFLLKAHEYLLGANELLSVMPSLRSSEDASAENNEPTQPQQSFIELGRLWQAPMFEITLNFPRSKERTSDEGCQRQLSVFGNSVVNDMEDDVEAEFLNSRYIIPRESCFYISDLKHIKNLVPDDDACGFHLIVVDPPWENGSAHQKLRYPTLPNRYFLSIPIKQLAHEEGALVALWVTNREKLRSFVEKELFPSWGVRHVATFHWLKVKADGSLICELDLFHHKPYESLLLGYCTKKGEDFEKLSIQRDIPDNQVMLSIPGDYSRKPPVQDLLLEFIPGFKPPRCVELFAREMRAGWLSWGNEPLCFQESRYFQSPHG